MQPIASGLSADQRRALAAYISALPVPAVPLPADPAQPAPTAQALRLGARLAERGRWSSKLPGCDQCHGPSGVGVGAAFPPLSGQSGSYIRAQIDAYRQGTRPAGPLGLMAAVALRMTPDDIAAVAAYYPTLAVAPSATGARHP
jgi:cytochrome c553